MSHYVLDACALVNLYCGWGGLAELRKFGDSWSIGDIALREAVFVREFDQSGNLYKVVLSPEAVVADGNLHVASLDSEDEQSSLIEFARDLDDGEAQALVIAMHRKKILVTDDRPAIRVANALSPAVPSLGTPEILKAWVESTPENQMRLVEVVRRISILGPFQLRKTSANYIWWRSLLS